MKNNRCLLIRGWPGTGKSTFVHKMFPNILHLENDMFHYHSGEYEYNQYKMRDAINWCVRTCEDALKNNMDVVISNTFTRKAFVDSYKRLAEKYGAKFTVYRMMGNFNNIHNVPQNVLDNMKNNFEDYPGEIKIYPVENGEYNFDLGVDYQYYG